MRRRDLILASAAWGALVAARARAQSKVPKVIGWLAPFSRDSQKAVLEGFRAQLKELGQVEGREYVIEGRWSDGSVEPLPALARELLALKPAVIVTAGSAAVAVLKKETRTVPIVFASAGDPVASGFVESLRHPGGNITGVMLRSELQGKLLELIREFLPAARRLALLEHETDPAAKMMAPSYQRAASALRYELRIVRVARIEEIERAFAEAVNHKSDALIAPQLSLFILHSQKIGSLALKARLPLFSTWRNFTATGGLLSYFSDFRENTRRSAVLVDKILRGASPAELPVEQPDRYTLVVNRRTAEALGIRIPQSLLLRADEVIE